jgi:hypothetical protein
VLKCKKPAELSAGFFRYGAEGGIRSEFAETNLCIPAVALPKKASNLFPVEISPRIGVAQISPDGSFELWFFHK